MLTDRASQHVGPRPADADPAVVGHRHRHRRDRRLAAGAPLTDHAPARASTPPSARTGSTVTTPGHRASRRRWPASCDQPQRHRHPDRGRRDHRPERRPAAQLPGDRRPDLHVHQVRRDRRLPGHAPTRSPPPRPSAGAAAADRLRRRCWPPTTPPGQRCGTGGSTCSATRRWPPTSTPASSTCGRAPATAWTGASPPPACPPTATTATSSGTPRRGCTRRCWPSTPTWPRAWTPTASTACTPAQQHATATGYQGARFPWESALDGTEQIPPPVSVNSEGLYEQHITADIALAQWQYYLATGDRSWLADQGWPVISGAAAFWASRATRGGRRQLPHRPRHRSRRGEPQRQRRGVHQRRREDDAAGRHRRRRGRSARPRRRRGRRSPPGSSVPSRYRRQRVHPEFSGYRGAAGQAGRRDAAAVPVAVPDVAQRSPPTTSTTTCRAPIPGGPSMSDAVNSIDSSTLGTPRLLELRLHRAQLPAVHPRRLRPVLRDQDRRRVHVHDRDRRLPAGVPLRLLRPAL